MLRLINYTTRTAAVAALQRPASDMSALSGQLSRVIADVKSYGDLALRRYAFLYDGVVPEYWEPGDAEWAAADTIPEALKQAFHQAADNIERFHEAQRPVELVLQTMPGVVCRRRAVPVPSVGLYVPGGTAALSSTLLMLGIPARLAGCGEIVVCTPPDRSGRIDPAILYVAKMLGLKQVFKTGGAQAIAAMAYGTESIPKVHKLFGPGNRYVTAAKSLLQAQGIAIDMPAGPSEVAVLADSSCHPAFVAADLLSQAEHAADAQVVLVCTEAGVYEAVKTELGRQLRGLPRAAIAAAALASSCCLLVPDLEAGMAVLNEYAPEHLIISTRDPWRWAGQVRNAGSVFIGPYSPESAGDYASGTNHTLPTNGYAAAYSGLSLDSFMKYITFQELSAGGLNALGDTIMQMARAEGLEAHARAVQIRMDLFNEKNNTL